MAIMATNFLPAPPPLATKVGRVGGLVSSGLCLLCAPALAGTYYSGTGFVVSRQGHVVTNAHVLEKCLSTQVRTTDGAFHPARIAAHNPDLDLAILSTPLEISRPARLRHRYTGVQVQEKVMVMGYPQEAAREGKYRVAYSSVRALTGITGESQWLQFEDSVRMGNSGGPLLDYAGNVVGVVTGKATLVKHNAVAARDEVVDSADIAINLDTLRSFLNAHRISYESRDSLMKLSSQNIEASGRDYIVNVLCEQAE